MQIRNKGLYYKNGEWIPFPFKRDEDYYSSVNYVPLKNVKLKREIREQSCYLCSGKSTDIHHNDRESQNNRPENLIPLCRGCHYTVHGKVLVTKKIERQIVKMRKAGKYYSDIKRELGVSVKTMYRIFHKHNLV